MKEGLPIFLMVANYTDKHAQRFFLHCDRSHQPCKEPRSFSFQVLETPLNETLSNARCAHGCLSAGVFIAGDAAMFPSTDTFWEFVAFS